MMFLRWSLEGCCQGLKKADPKLWGFHNPQTLQVLSKVLLFDNFCQEPQLKYSHSKSHYCTFLRKANWGQLSCLMRFWWATKTISPKTMRSQSGRAGHSVQLVKSLFWVPHMPDRPPDSGFLAGEHHYRCNRDGQTDKRHGLQFEKTTLCELIKKPEQDFIRRPVSILLCYWRLCENPLTSLSSSQRGK